MDLTCTSLYLGLFLLAGYVVICALIGKERRHLAEIIGLSGMIGAFGIGTLQFWLSLAGTPPDGGVLTVFFLAGLCALAALAFKRRLVVPAPFFQNARLADFWMILPGLLLAWTFVFVSIYALGYRVYEWDAYAIWCLKAKMFWLEPLSRLGPILHDCNLAYSHPNYPPLIPFLMSGAFAAMGHDTNDAAVKAIFPFLLISFAFMLYGSLRTHLNRTVSLGFATLAISLPGVVDWASAGVADVPLMIFYGASLVYLLRWIEERKESDLLFMVLFTVAMGSSKMEGLALGGINMVALGLFGFWEIPDKPRVARLWKAALLLLVLLAPLLYWNHTLPQNMDIDLSQMTAATFISNLSRMPAILSSLVGSLFRMDLWSGLWPLALIAALMGLIRRPDRQLLLLLFLLAAHLGTLFAAYFATSWELQQHLATSLDRVMLHLVPCAILLCAHAVRTCLRSVPENP